MKVLVIGAGPLGSLFTVRLHQAGLYTTLMARGQRLEELKTHGVVLRDEQSNLREVVRVPLTDTLSPDDYYDLVIIIMRKNQALELLPVLEANTRIPSYLFMMNHAAGSEELTRKLGADRVLLGFPLPGGSLEGSTVILASMGRNTYTLPLGTPDGRITPQLKEASAVLECMEGYRTQIRRDMTAWLTYHAAMLMPALVPALYASGLSMKRLAETRDLLILSVRGIKETLKALRRLGIPPAPKSVRFIELIPEPLFVLLLRRILRREYAKASVEGHPRNARDEMQHITDELLRFIDPPPGSLPAVEALRPYFDPSKPPYPKHKQDIPFRWTGVLIPLFFLFLIILVLTAAL